TAWSLTRYWTSRVVAAAMNSSAVSGSTQRSWRARCARWWWRNVMGPPGGAKISPPSPGGSKISPPTPGGSLQLPAFVAGEAERAASVVDAHEIAEIVRLAVHVMAGGACDAPLVGKRQGGRRRPRRDAGLVRWALVTVTRGAARLQVRGEETARGRRIGVQ